jgi:hypothetical protein
LASVAPGGADCTLDPRPQHVDEIQCYIPDEPVPNQGDETSLLPRDNLRNGLYQRWMWCGTSCWLLINDADKEIVIFDGYVSKDTIGNPLDDPSPHSVEGLNRIQQLANFLRALGTGPAGYRIKGLIVMHNHGDHTIDVEPLLQALAAPGVFDYLEDSHGTKATEQPDHDPIDYCVPVIIDANGYGSDFETADGFSGNPSTYYVKFGYPGEPSADEMDDDFMNAQRFNISETLNNGADEICPDCEQGQFKLGHFEFNAYVWDHLGEDSALADADLDHVRTFAFRVWHDTADQARRAFMTGSAGEMTNHRSLQIFDNDHHDHHSHELLELLGGPADDVFGGYPTDRIDTDLMIPALPSFYIDTTLLVLGVPVHISQWVGEPGLVAASFRDFVHFIDRPCDLLLGCPPRYVLPNHYDHNEGTEDEMTEVRFLPFVLNPIIATWDWTDNYAQHHDTWDGVMSEPDDWRRMRRLTIDYDDDEALANFSASQSLDVPPMYKGGPDRDCDGVKDADDNCLLTNNPAQNAGACVHPLPGCVVPLNPPVAWWPFDGAQGSGANTIYPDISGNENHAQTGYYSEGLASDAGGKVNGALKLDGRWDWAQVEPAEMHDPKQLTIETWIYPDKEAQGDSEWGILQWRMDDPNVDTGYALTYRANEGIYFHKRCNGDGKYELFRVEEDVDVDDGAWNHIAVVHDQREQGGLLVLGDLNIYVNGEPRKLFRCSEYADCPDQVTSADRIDMRQCFGTGQPWVIGMFRPDSECGSGPNDRTCFDGRIDELTVYECPLGRRDIRAIYEAAPADPNDGRAGKCKEGSAPPPIEGPSFRDIASCQKQTGKGVRKLGKDLSKIMGRCHLDRDKGKIPVDDCNELDDASDPGIQAEVQGAIAKFLDKVPKPQCAELAPADAGYLACEGAPIQDWAQVASCVVAKTVESVEQMGRDFLGNPPPGLAEIDPAAFRCHTKVAKAQQNVVNKGVQAKLTCMAGEYGLLDRAQVQDVGCRPYPRAPLNCVDDVKGKLDSAMAKSESSVAASCDPTVPPVGTPLFEPPLCPVLPGLPFPTQCLMGALAEDVQELGNLGFQL